MNKELMEFHFYDSDSFEVGYIISRNDKLICICNVSPDMQYDGITIRYIKDILYVEKNTQYLSKLINNNIKPKTIDFDLVLENILEYLKNRNILVEFSIDTNVLIGFIKNIDGEVVFMSTVDENGIYDGEVYFRKDDIESFDFDNVELRNISKRVK